MSLENAQALMEEVGPTVDQLEAVDQFGDHEWELIIEGEAGVLVTYSPDTKNLTLETDLGLPETDQRLLVYDTLLSYNGLWRETGGLRFATDGPDGSVRMLLDLPSADLDGPTLKTAIEGFLDRAAFWSSFVEGEGAAADEGTAPADPALRV